MNLEIYNNFYEDVKKIISSDRVFTDPLHTLAYGTDASFYRLIPKVVIFVNNAKEVKEILKISSKMSLPVVFRAAGTSLSGQAITDSILIVTSRDFNSVYINQDASLVKIEPSAIGGDVNQKLLKFRKKIGPDPASISCAMVGGIVANNASGMCCGVSDNSYKTIKDIKVIFYDGSQLDTSCKKSIEGFKQTHGLLIEGINSLHLRVKKDRELFEKIEKKFRIKNTCGYSLNALIDFDDPIEIIKHLLVGSEGTLGFIQEVTLKTVEEYKDKASALIFYESIDEACEAVKILKQKCQMQVNAAEIMDRASLKSVENKEGMPEILKNLKEGVTALLVETRASSSKTLYKNIEHILENLSQIKSCLPIEFTTKKEEYEKFWKVRKGLFPTIGALREAGTTVIIEDVAYPIDFLSEATLELQSLFKKYGYSEAIIFGHALEGNLHFVFTQSFENKEEIERYEEFMQEVTNQVAIKYSGSLKAEHGTGRNMAPFVELEWGEKAYSLMKEIKYLFDPKNLLNPGVILNSDEKVHLKNLKKITITNEKIDSCIECGFCEPSCPSNSLTLTPRQRIASFRYLQSLKNDNNLNLFKEVDKIYEYSAVDSCATCSLCSITCPIGIDTANLTKRIRSKKSSAFSKKIAKKIVNNYDKVLLVMRVALCSIKWLNRYLISSDKMTKISLFFRKFSKNRLPLWIKSLPDGQKFNPQVTFKSKDKVVYFSSCINRNMANAGSNDNERPIFEVVIDLLQRAGYEVIIPKNIEKLCCGMPFSSKGFFDEALEKSNELQKELYRASDSGKYPILCDMSPCSKTINETFSKELKVYDSIEFIDKFLLDRLTLSKIEDRIVIHATCSTKKSHLEDRLYKIAKRCSKEVIVPKSVTCCGFAGDRGFFIPELNKSALKGLKKEIPVGTKYAFSTSKTCEIGLSEHSGLDYKSIFYLIDKCSM